VSKLWNLVGPCVGITRGELYCILVEGAAGVTWEWDGDRWRQASPGPSKPPGAIRQPLDEALIAGRTPAAAG
jgi:hypothetical protein